jgi:hypothetical protein
MEAWGLVIFPDIADSFGYPFIAELAKLICRLHLFFGAVVAATDAVILFLFGIIEHIDVEIAHEALGAPII